MNSGSCLSELCALAGPFLQGFCSLNALLSGDEILLKRGRPFRSTTTFAENSVHDRNSGVAAKSSCATRRKQGFRDKAEALSQRWKLNGEHAESR